MVGGPVTGESRPLLVSRGRLTAALTDTSVGLVEAGGGYGKSVLASQCRQTLGIASVHLSVAPADRDPAVFVASFRRALQDASLSDLASALEGAQPAAWVEHLLDGLTETPDGVLIVVDDAHNLRGEQSSSEALTRLAQGMPARHRLLVTARSFVGALEPLWALEHAAHLESRDLAFTLEEAAELIAMLSGRPARDHDVRMLVEATQGWVTALLLAARAWAVEDRAPVWLSREPVAAALRSLLAGLSLGDREAVVSLAQLPFLAPELVDAVVGSGGFDRLLAAGLPIHRSGSGWWELPGPVTDFLGAQAQLDPRIAETAATFYDLHGDGLAAIRVLIGAGSDNAAAVRLAGLSPRQGETLGFAVVREIVESLSDEAVSAHPRVLLHFARLAETSHLMESRADALRRAWEKADSGEHSDPWLLRELEAERARDLMWDERDRIEARARAERVLADSGPDETLARARSLDVLGRLGTWFSVDGPKPEAEALLQESARLARRAGERTWAAQALVALGGGFYFALCRFERALETLDEALGELPMRNRYRVMVQSFRADALTELGRFSEAGAALEEMRQIGRVFAEDWMLAYASWGEALLASYQGDAQRTVGAVSEALKHPLGWLEQPSGVEFLAQAADYLDRVGEHDRARELMQMASDRMDGSEHLVRVHGAAIAARSGDPDDAGVEIERALSEWAIEPQEEWPLLLLGGFAAMRRNDPQAGVLAARAFDRCMELGHLQGPLIREPVVARQLLPLARASGSVAARQIELAGGGDSWELEILGGFVVRRADQQLALPAGRPERAVKRLAVAGGRVHREALMEFLWPETPAEVGRNRMRNLLSRIRMVAGELIVREGDTIALAAGCEIDAARFDAGAERALAARSAGEADAAAGLARAALGLYRGELLPDDEYEDWVLVPRERLRALQLELLDLLVAAAEGSGEIDEAVRLARTAIGVEPHDERRHLVLAELLAMQGRTGSARAGLERALNQDEHWSASAREQLELALRRYDSGLAGDKGV
jgi:ATP/maltotriose-dependent transcriptional regulator MalT/DNA-binding SARP family transcriptional activator